MIPNSNSLFGVSKYIQYTGILWFKCHREYQIFVCRGYRAMTPSLTVFTCMLSSTTLQPISAASLSICQCKMKKKNEKNFKNNKLDVFSNMLLHVTTFDVWLTGSLLGEKTVATWQRSCSVRELRCFFFFIGCYQRYACNEPNEMQLLAALNHYWKQNDIYCTFRSHSKQKKVAQCTWLTRSI